MPDAIHIARDQQHALPEPRQRHGGFAARMSRAYDYTIEHKLFLGKSGGGKPFWRRVLPPPYPNPSQDFRLVGRMRNGEFRLMEKKPEMVSSDFKYRRNQMDTTKVLADLKKRPGFTDNVGMVLVHNGVVRGWARANHAPVKSMKVSHDRAKMDAICRELEQRPWHLLHPRRS